MFHFYVCPYSMYDVYFKFKYLDISNYFRKNKQNLKFNYNNFYFLILCENTSIVVGSYWNMNVDNILMLNLNWTSQFGPPKNNICWPGITFAALEPNSVTKIYNY